MVKRQFIILVLCLAALTLSAAARAADRSAEPDGTADVTSEAPGETAVSLGGDSNGTASLMDLMEKVYVWLNYTDADLHAQNLRTGETYTIAYVLYDEEGRMLSMGTKTLVFPASFSTGLDIYGPKPQDRCKIILMDADAVPRSHAIRILFTE